MRSLLLCAAALCALDSNAHADGFSSQGVPLICGRDDGAYCLNLAQPSAPPYYGEGPAARVAGRTADGVPLPTTSPYGTGRDDAMSREYPLGPVFFGFGADDWCHTGATRCGHSGP